MRRRLLFIFSIILIVIGLFIFVKIIDSFRNSEKGALQVTANIKSTVFINDRPIGSTPLCKCEQNETLKATSYDLRIEPEDTSYSAYTVRVDINGGVLTAVERTFLPGSLASASILTLEKSGSEKPSLLITSIPEGAIVTINSIPSGVTPYSTDSLSPSEHEIEIQKQGFQKKTIRIRTVENHRLIVTAILGTQGDTADEEETEEQKDEATEPTPTPDIETITILSTPTSFLRVREGPGISFSEVDQIDPGETFEFLDEDNGWYEIKVNSDTTGWVSSRYAKKD